MEGRALVVRRLSAASVHQGGCQEREGAGPVGWKLLAAGSYHQTLQCLEPILEHKRATVVTQAEVAQTQSHTPARTLAPVQAAKAQAGPPATATRHCRCSCSPWTSCCPALHCSRTRRRRARRPPSAPSPNHSSCRCAQACPTSQALLLPAASCQHGACTALDADAASPPPDAAVLLLLLLLPSVFQRGESRSSCLCCCCCLLPTEERVLVIFPLARRTGAASMWSMRRTTPNMHASILPLGRRACICGSASMHMHMHMHTPHTHSCSSIRPKAHTVLARAMGLHDALRI